MTETYMYFSTRTLKILVASICQSKHTDYLNDLRNKICCLQETQAFYRLQETELTLKSRHHITVKGRKKESKQMEPESKLVSLILISDNMEFSLK